MEHPLSDMMTNSMSKIKDMVDVNTVVGSPITTPGGVTIIPVTKVSIGYGGGGSDFATKNMPAKAIAAAIAIAAAAGAGAIAMGISIGKATEAISRQPEATDSIRGSLMIGLVFIETAIIYALIVAILVVFVL